MNEFVVYALLDPRKSGQFTYEDYDFDFEPFYIGKGSQWRPYVHQYYAAKSEGYCSSRKTNRIRGILREGYDVIVKILYSKLDERTALETEARIIKLIGRKDLETGVLLNLTGGGEGSTGRLMSQDTRDKIGNRNYPTGSGHHNYGVPMPDSVREAFDRTGVLHTEETKEKQRQASCKMWKDTGDQIIKSRVSNKSRQFGFNDDVDAYIAINRMTQKGATITEVAKAIGSSVNYVRSRNANGHFLSPIYETKEFHSEVDSRVDSNEICRR